MFVSVVFLRTPPKLPILFLFVASVSFDFFVLLQKKCRRTTQTVQHILNNIDNALNVDVSYGKIKLPKALIVVFSHDPKKLSPTLHHPKHRSTISA
jgi:hypothetical protein